MRLAPAPWLVGLSMLCSGCALFEDASRNACSGLSRVIETHQESKRNRQWAEAAWQQTCPSLAPTQRTEDYEQGFKAGYADYLFRGGDGEPPLIAPDRYRHLRYQNPQGYQAVEEWFAGYRHGAGVARDTKARQWITGPSSLTSAVHDLEVHDVAARKPGAALAEPKEIASVPARQPLETKPSAPKTAPGNLETPPLTLPVFRPIRRDEGADLPKPVNVPEAAPSKLETPPLTIPVPRSIPRDEVKYLPKPVDVPEAAPSKLETPPLTIPEPRPIPRDEVTNLPKPVKPNSPILEGPTAKIINVAEPPMEPMRARITNVTEPAVEPMRARITTIRATPNQE